jgi:histidine ammonia-lyase
MRDDPSVTVVLNGRTLALDDVVAVARGDAIVEVAEDAIAGMQMARATAERALTAGESVYGLTTGVGVRKTARVESDAHDRLLVRQHLIGQGPAAPRDVVRATALCLLNGLARGTTPARPELALHVAARLNDDRLPSIRVLGSVGQADLAQMADLADGILDGFQAAPGEAIALLNRNAFSTGWGALAVADAVALVDALDVTGALDFEAFGANRTVLDPVVATTRTSPGLSATLERLSALLEGGVAEPRNLQDPLSFRTLPQVHGATRDALAFVRAAVESELNASQSNPLVVAEEDRIVSVGCFEAVALATALDLARLTLAPALSSAAERSLKLLQASQSGLAEGLAVRPGLAESALSELGIALQAIAAEARLLAPPVSLELVSTTQAEGIEDRTTMAPLGARRLAEMVDLGARIAALGLLIAAQACDLRGTQLGTGTHRAHALVRRVVPFMDESDPLPDIEPLVALVHDGAFRS